MLGKNQTRSDTRESTDTKNSTHRERERERESPSADGIRQHINRIQYIASKDEEAKQNKGHQAEQSQRTTKNPLLCRMCILRATSGPTATVSVFHWGYQTIVSILFREDAALRSQARLRWNEVGRCCHHAAFSVTSQASYVALVSLPD